MSVPVPIIDVRDSSLRVPSLLSEKSPTLELSDLPSRTSAIFSVAPVALPVPENVIVVGVALYQSSTYILTYI